MPVKQALVELLRDWDTEFIFGNPGSTEVPLLDTLVDYADLQYILAPHEAIAISMADAYAQLSGRPGVVSVHATPGVANIVGGLFLASAHRSPVVVLAGQQDSRLLTRRPFLASDVVGLVRQHTKWAWQATSGRDVIGVVHRAFQVATRPPTGPVLVAIPRDLHDEIVDYPTLGRESPVNRGIDPAAIAKAAKIIAGAEVPVLLSGNGVGAGGQAAVDGVVALAELVGARVYSEHNATNMHFPGSHPQYLGGNAHGSAEIREWLAPADVIIAVGCDLFMEDRYHETPLIPPGARIVQVDEDPLEIGRIFPVSAGVVGNVAQAVAGLTLAVDRLLEAGDRRTIDDRKRQIRTVRATVQRKRDQVAESLRDQKPIRMTRVYEELRLAMRDSDIMVDEAVNMASYLHDFFEFRRARTLLSSKQGWLGWAWGAALGAQLANPDARVVACLGDGSATYTVQALWVARHYRIPITAVILANGRYVAVENHLRAYGGRAAAERRYIGTDLGFIDFAAIATGFGVRAEVVEDPDRLGPALRRALDSAEPTLIQVMIDPDDAGYGRDPIPR